MKVASINFVEDCLDGTALRDIVLDGLVDEVLIAGLSARGQIDVYAHFPIPYFRGSVGTVGVMGTSGSASFRVVLPAEQPEAALCTLVGIVEAAR